MVVELKIYREALPKEKKMVAAIERYAQARIEYSWKVEYSWKGARDPRDVAQILEELRVAEAEIMNLITNVKS